ncbi:hypothetical protein [Amycolatopsis anabasis]|uniref:hypothetical protein n=1 Tax=Amycolatopsis anabasis TaxID=1840409 RepID=UPI00131D193B|nr:hypothetical protein [Amycolatopsis anabasis]
MSLYAQTGVSVETWVELGGEVAKRFEVDRENNCVTLYFGEPGDFILHVDRENLEAIVELGLGALLALRTG